jgi:hypothetical protein
MKSRQTFMDRLTRVVGTRYGALLVVLLLLLVFYSFADDRGAIRWVVDLCVLALIGSALHAISGRRWIRRFVIFAGLGVMLLGTLARELDLETVYPAGIMLRVVMYGVIIVVIFNDVLKRQQVDMDAVLGVCCVYLLIGVAWQSVYTLVEWQIPNSFALPSGTPGSGVGHDLVSIQADLIYFSLITMTTIGYGDITPISSPARVLSALQGVVAQLYVAIVIARMVGMELAHRRNGPTQTR